jgi:hypothetical protein
MKSAFTNLLRGRKDVGRVRGKGGKKKKKRRKTLGGRRVKSPAVTGPSNPARAPAVLLQPLPVHLLGLFSHLPVDELLVGAHVAPLLAGLAGDGRHPLARVLVAQGKEE